MMTSLWSGPSSIDSKDRPIAGATPSVESRPAEMRVPNSSIDEEPGQHPGDRRGRGYSNGERAHRQRGVGAALCKKPSADADLLKCVHEPPPSPKIGPSTP